MSSSRSEILKKVIKQEYVEFFSDWEDKTAREREKRGLDVIGHIFATRGTKKYGGQLFEDKVKSATTNAVFEYFLFL